MWNKWYAIPMIASLMGCPGGGGGVKPSPSPSPVVSPTPTPPEATPTPVPTPTPLPTPEPCNPVELRAGYDGTPAHVNAVRAAQAALGDVCGQVPEESLRRLATQLGMQGYCAYQDEDRVFVARRQDSLEWEEHHAVYYGNGCWLSNPYRGTFPRKVVE